ncbi:MAG TPA: SGNH/GDSL hydrolase family protein [Gammaproteobacteria bacterium]|nr:SGNH/GDSL hydrolase family protein [Gammaproteobacteria bacterium]
MPTFRELRLQLLIVGFSVASISAAEIGLRLVFPDKIPPTVDYEFLVPDATLSYRIAPSTAGTFLRDDENGTRIHWTNNRLGYRGDELLVDGTPRVVVLGDSNVQAVFSALEDTFPEQLEKNLIAELGSSVEVVNAGVVGYGPDHYLLRMMLDLESLHPDALVINVFADNDLGDVLRHRLFDLRDGELVPRKDRFILTPWSFPQRVQRFAGTRLLTKVANKIIAPLLPRPDGEPRTDGRTDRIGALEELTALESRNYGTPGSEILLVDHYDIDVAVNPNGESARLKVQLMRALAAEITKRAARAGTPLLVVVEPSRVDLTMADSVNYAALTERYPEYDRRRLSSTIATIFAEQGADVVNLYDVFLANDADTLYFAGADSHWNDHGQQVAARAVAPRVAEFLRQKHRH